MLITISTHDMLMEFGFVILYRFVPNFYLTHYNKPTSTKNKERRTCMMTHEVYACLQISETVA